MCGLVNHSPSPPTNGKLRIGIKRRLLKIDSARLDILQIFGTRTSESAVDDPGNFSLHTSKSAGIYRPEKPQRSEQCHAEVIASPSEVSEGNALILRDFARPLKPELRSM
jgi:hypothetical protein